MTPPPPGQPAGQPRIPLTGSVLALWGSNDAVGFLRAWVTGEVPQGAHGEHTGNRMVEVPGAGSVVMAWTPGPQLANLTGGVHGGYLALVCDEAAGLAAASTGQRFVPMITLDLDVTYLRPAVLGQQHRVEGAVLHAGRQRIVSEARILTPQGKLAVSARGSFVPNSGFVERLQAQAAG
jgi:uncharacterized protein (TIGR00369 family)